MVEILKYNDDELNDNEIDEVVTRVRAFVLSSKNYMMLGKTDDGYQLFECYVGAEEKLEDAFATYIYNETGIVFDNKDIIEPFLEIRHYTKNYQNSGKNRMSDLVYFFIKSDKIPNYKRLKLTDAELSKKMPVELISRTLFSKRLNDFSNSTDDPLKKIRIKDILIAYDKLRAKNNWD